MNFLDTADDPKRAERWPLYYFLLASLAVGAAASLFTEPNLGWYTSLAHPSFAPPAWLLPPVWTALYVLMAVAAWRAWKVTGLKSTAMALYGLQLASTLVWTALFFGPHQIGLALDALVLLVLLRLITNFLFWWKERWAGLMFLPVLGWAGFEAALVYGFHTLNP
jgi:translocator protein